MARNYSAEWSALSNVALRFGWKVKDGVLLNSTDKPIHRIKVSRGRFCLCHLDGDRLDLGGYGKKFVSWDVNDPDGLARYLREFRDLEPLPIAAPKPVAIQRDLFGQITSVRSLTPKPAVQQLSLI